MMSQCDVIQSWIYTNICTSTVFGIEYW
jgi:hypothetical protein